MALIHNIVGAVAVDEQEHALCGGRTDDVVDQSHGRLAKFVWWGSIGGGSLGTSDDGTLLR